MNQLVISGVLGWGISVVYSVCAVALWSRALLLDESSWHRVAAVVTAIAWSIFAGRALYGMAVHNEAMRAVWYGGMAILLLAAGTLMYSALAFNYKPISRSNTYKL